MDEETEEIKQVQAPTEPTDFDQGMYYLENANNRENAIKFAEQTKDSQDFALAG